MRAQDGDLAVAAARARQREDVAGRRQAEVLQLAAVRGREERAPLPGLQALLAQQALAALRLEGLDVAHVLPRGREEAAVVVPARRARRRVRLRVERLERARVLGEVGLRLEQVARGAARAQRLERARRHLARAGRRQQAQPRLQRLQRLHLGLVVLLARAGLRAARRHGEERRPAAELQVLQVLLLVLQERLLQAGEVLARARLAHAAVEGARPAERGAHVQQGARDVALRLLVLGDLLDLVLGGGGDLVGARAGVRLRAAPALGEPAQRHALAGAAVRAGGRAAAAGPLGLLVLHAAAPGQAARGRLGSGSVPAALHRTGVAPLPLGDAAAPGELRAAANMLLAAAAAAAAAAAGS